MSDQQNPALIAAAAAEAKVAECLAEGRSFRLEAGAGAGKTYSLVEALKHLIAKDGPALMQTGRKVACITYTEVARDEIARKIEKHPAVMVDTIHAFSWAFMAQFQTALRELVAQQEHRREKLEAGGGVEGKRVEYSLGFFGVTEQVVTLGHDDIPRFMAELMSRTKFRQLLARQFPVLFIDEYQDTDKHFAASLMENFLAPKTGPLIGLFGDHWQTIYRGDFQLADFLNVVGIDKGSNFRSAPAVVNVLNELRPELPQQVSDPTAAGEARFFHANSYTGTRTSSAHSKGDTPPEVSRAFAKALTKKLTDEGWDFDPEKTKVLMLTHNALAAEQGYPSIAEIFDYNEAFAKKENPVIEFCADVIEPVAEAFSASRYGQMFWHLGKAPGLQAHTDKLSWREDLDALNERRQSKTVGDVIDLLKTTRRPRLPDNIMRREDDLSALAGAVSDDEPKSITQHRNLRGVPYGEVIELVKWLEGKTPFATKHSVKGAEFENVLVILGGGWNHYNWPQLFELLQSGAVTSKNEKGYHRARNLFYVAISRPKKRLAVLATQMMSAEALSAVSRLFGADHVHELPVPDGLETN